MSIQSILQRVTPEELAVLETEAGMDAYIEEAFEPATPGLEVESWLAVQLMLTQTPFEGDVSAAVEASLLVQGPACFMLRGGRELATGDWGYDAPRVLVPRELKAVHAVVRDHPERVADLDDIRDYLADASSEDHLLVLYY